MGPIWGPEWTPKFAQNWPKSGTKFMLTFLSEFSIFSKQTHIVFTSVKHQQTNFVCWVLDPKIGPNIIKNGVKKLTHFWTCFSDFQDPFWVHFGSYFGVKEAMMRQDGPKKDLKSLKVRKSNHCKKCDFTMENYNF